MFIKYAKIIDMITGEIYEYEKVNFNTIKEKLFYHNLFYNVAINIDFNINENQELIAIINYQ